MEARVGAERGMRQRIAVDRRIGELRHIARRQHIGGDDPAIGLHEKGAGLVVTVAADTGGDDAAGAETRIEGAGRHQGAILQGLQARRGMRLAAGGAVAGRRQ